MGRTATVTKPQVHSKRFTFKYQGATVAQGVTGKYYPADDVVVKKGLTPVRNPPKTRSSITPGTVLIVLAGRFRGKRVVCLKVLTSGLLLITGPFNVNGVPLRRVNQRYVIATSTKVSLNGVEAAGIDDAFFAREKAKKLGKKSEAALFDVSKKTSERLEPARKEAQGKIDAALTANIILVPQLRGFLKASFRLTKGNKPHLMKF